MAAGQRIAVVGSGITGLSCAWLLQRNEAKVTLFESEASAGGHTLTDTTAQWPVDLGFQVYNLTTYPNLVGFFDALGVDTEPSDMSFALSMDQGKLEWASHNLSTIFIQRKNLLSPKFLRMVYDVIRFGQQAPKVLDPEQAHIYSPMTLGQYLDNNGYSDAFKFNYVLPMCAAVWSVPNATVLSFPVQMLVRFWVNHHLLDLVQRPCWRVVKGRSRTYVQKVLAELPDVRLGTPVARVQRTANGVQLTTAAGQTELFDAVVLATHSDISLQLLGSDATEDEEAVLGAIPYNNNDVYLHTDEKLMPVDKNAWASWNFLGDSKTSADADSSSAVTVSYWLNRLQHLPPEAPQMFVTLNPAHPPAGDKVIKRLRLAHPVYSFASNAAQAKLPSIQGTGGVYYAGAWASYGFHEDGIKAGVAVAKLLGAGVPWGNGISSSPKMGLGDMFWLALFDRFAQASISVGQLRLILPNGEERHYGGSEDTIPALVPTGEEWRGVPARKATVRVLRMNLFKKIVQRTDVGLGEAYMDGDFLVDDLAGFMAITVANARNLESQKGMLGMATWINDKLLAAAHVRRSNTREGSRKNIEEHYDAGNAMYATFLDQTMTYSAAIHTKDQNGDLQAAQIAKLDAVIAAAGIGPDDHVLEIGCGWGSFAIRAASVTGCRVTGLTLSKEQLAEAAARVAAAGLSNKVTLLLCDYRDCPGLGTYDKVVSIEMIEAVGHEHLVSYFATISAALKPAGKAVIQVIAQPDKRYEQYCRSSDFIKEHIFPGGHLPSMGAMVEAARGTDLAVTALQDIGSDYAITLRAWRAAWNTNKKQILDLGYSNSFWLKYDFYFAYCEAAFDAKYIHDFHITWEKRAVPAAAVTAVTGSDVVQQGSVVAAEVAALQGWVKQKLPSDTTTQVLLALYFFLAGLLVRRQPILSTMPITSTVFAMLHGLVSTTIASVSGSFNLLSAENNAWVCSAICQTVFSAAVAAAAVALAVAYPWTLLPLPASATATATNSLALAKLLGLPQPLSSQQYADVQHYASLITCAAAGYYAFQLWLLVRTRSGQYKQYTLLALLQYTLLLVVYGVASYKGVQVPLLAVGLACEASGAVEAAGCTLDLVGAGGLELRGVLFSLEKGLFPITRVIPQLLLTLLVVSSPNAFGSSVYYALAVTGMCVCQGMNVAKARSIYGPSSDLTGAVLTGPGSKGSAAVAGKKDS